MAPRRPGAPWITLGADRGQDAASVAAELIPTVWIRHTAQDKVGIAPFMAEACSIPWCRRTRGKPYPGDVNVIAARVVTGAFQRSQAARAFDAKRSGHGMQAHGTGRSLAGYSRGLGTAQSGATPDRRLHRTRAPKLSAHPAIIGAKWVQASVGSLEFQLEVCRIGPSWIDRGRRQAAREGASRRRRGRQEGGQCVTGTGPAQAPHHAGARAPVADCRCGPRWPRGRRSQSRRISIGPSRPPAKTWTCRCGTSWAASSPALASRR